MRGQSGMTALAVADPGFPVGGCAPIRWGMDLLCWCFSVKMYVITKELGHIGEGVRPPMACFV